MLDKVNVQHCENKTWPWCIHQEVSFYPWIWNIPETHVFSVFLTVDFLSLATKNKIFYHDHIIMHCQFFPAGTEEWNDSARFLKQFVTKKSRKEKIEIGFVLAYRGAYGRANVECIMSLEVLLHWASTTAIITSQRDGFTEFQWSNLRQAISEIQVPRHRHRGLVLKGLLRVRFYQAKASNQSQCCDAACDTVLIEINGVTPEWVTTSFWSNSICFHCFQWGHRACTRRWCWRMV